MHQVSAACLRLQEQQHQELPVLLLEEGRLVLQLEERRPAFLQQ
jgi:hypothetical protein